MVSRKSKSNSSSEKDELKALFEKLDVNKDGKICITDLLSTQNKRNKLRSNKSLLTIAESFLSRCGIAITDAVDFPKFLDYALEHDKKLEVAFDQIDEDNDGVISINDIINAFKKVDIHLEASEAEKLLEKVDQAGNLHIDYNEWREFLILHPAHDLDNIFSHWHHDALIDVGVDTSTAIPEDYTVNEKTSGKQIHQLTAGAIAGTVSRTCTAPIDRLKLMRQVHGYKHKGSSFIQAYKYMLNEGGLLSLWRGNTLSVIKIAPETALKYGTYEHYKRFLSSKSQGGVVPDFLQSNPQLTKFMAGSLSGLTAQSVIYPLEVLKTRMCLRKTGQYRSIWHCANSVYEEFGVRGFYRGFFINVCGILPYAGIELALYERCKAVYISQFLKQNELLSSTHEVSPPVFVIPVLAGFSSACGTVVTYPINLIRSKLQASTRGALVSRPNDNVPTLIKTIWLNDGIIGFYRGLATNLTKVIPAVGISLATYEALRQQFNLGPLGSG